MRQHNMCVCVCMRAFCVKMCAGLQSGAHLHTERMHTHHMLCCRITTLTFTFLTNFKISTFNKEHMSSLKTDLNKIETC